jgi:hypothetical protein
MILCLHSCVRHFSSFRHSLVWDYRDVAASGGYITLTDTECPRSVHSLGVPPAGAPFRRNNVAMTKCIFCWLAWRTFWMKYRLWIMEETVRGIETYTDLNTAATGTGVTRVSTEERHLFHHLDQRGVGEDSVHVWRLFLLRKSNCRQYTFGGEH